MDKRFYDIYKFPLHQLELVGVRLLKTDEGINKRPYYHFIGRFKCEVPGSFLSGWDNSQNAAIINELHGGAEEIGGVYKKRFVRRVRQPDGEELKWSFMFVFDLKPANIMDFEVAGDHMRIDALGYGQFS